MRRLVAGSVVVAAVATVAIVVMAGCGVDDTDALRVLRAQGFDAVVLGEYAWIGCGERESGRHFSARNARSERVSGIVCCGRMFKACTVRF